MFAHHGDKHLTPEELAEREGVPLETVYGWNKTGNVIRKSRGKKSASRCSSLGCREAEQPCSTFCSRLIRRIARR